MPFAATRLLILSLLAAGPLAGQQILKSEVTGERLGHSLLVLDLDGDGRVEVLAGAPRNSEDGYSARGRVLVATAGSDGGEPRIVHTYGADVGHEFGFAMASGDLNGDGVADVLIGAPAADRDRGQLHIFLGAKGGNALSSSRKLSASSSGLTLEGEIPGGRFGSAMAVADLDGDGRAELIVGAPSAKVGLSSPYAGQVYVFAGRKSWGGGTERVGKGKFKPVVTVLGRENEGLGHAIAVGDFIGDEHQDVAMGAPWYPRGGKGRIGGVHVLAGAKRLSKGKAKSIELDHEKLGLWLKGSSKELGFVLCAHDLDEDKRAELLVGDPHASVGRLQGAGQLVGVGRGIAPILDLKGAKNDDVRLDILPSGVASEGFAGALWSGHLAGAQALPDLLIASPQASRVVLVQDASPLPATLIPTQAFMPRGNAKGFGSAVGAGDWNGKGGPEVVITAPGSNRIYIYELAK